MNEQVLVITNTFTGIAFAGFVGKHGYHVSLSCDIDQLSTKYILEKDGFRIIGDIDHRFCPILPNDFGKAVKASGIIVILWASPQYDAVFQKLAEFNLVKHTIVVVPGGGFTILAGFKLQRERFPRIILETSSVPFVGIGVPEEPYIVLVQGLKKTIEISASSRASSSLKSTVGQLFAVDLDWSFSPGSIFFSQIDRLILAPALLRLLTFEGTGDRPPVQDLLPSASRAALLDAERLAIATALGFKSKPAAEFLSVWYREAEDDGCTVFSDDTRGDSLRHILGPFVLMREIGAICGVRTPGMDEFIDEAGRALRAFCMEGWTLQDLALNGAPANDLVEALDGGRLVSRLMPSGDGDTCLTEGFDDVDLSNIR